MSTVAETLHSQLFDDFLAMAGELEAKGYHSPAVVLAGSVLEEHVRKLAARYEVQVVTNTGEPRSFDQLTTALVQATVVSQPQRMLLAGWYAQRNAAAHGQHHAVVLSEIGPMISGIRGFIVAHPA
jgi:hypothetical protein